MPLSLTEVQIAELLEMAPLIDRIETSLIAFSAGKVTQLARVLREVKPYGGYFKPMPAVSNDAVGVKLVSF